MGSSSVTSGWWGMVSSLFDLFGKCGFLKNDDDVGTRCSCVSVQDIASIEILSTFRTCVHCGLFSITATATATAIATATAKTTYGPNMTLQIVPSLKRCIAFTRIFRSFCLVARWHLY